MSNPLKVIKVDARTRLELLGKAHAETLFRLVDENREFLGRWMAFVPFVLNEMSIRMYIAGVIQRRRQQEEWAYVIVRDGEMAGRVGLHRIDLMNGTAELGYWLAGKWEGQGLAGAACRALMDRAFAEGGLHRLEIRCGEGNMRSRALAERLGFREEGLLREAERLNGSWHDLVVYGRCVDDPA